MSKLDHLTASNTTVLLIDHNLGFSGTIGSGPQTDVERSAAALARVAKIFDLPLIVTSADPKGMSGDLVPQLKAAIGDTGVIIRPDAIMDSMLDEGVAAAVRAANRPKLVLGGVLTEVCATFASLTALKEGYEVYLAIDACGGLSRHSHEYGIDRVVQADGIPVTWPVVASEIQLRWAGAAASTAGAVGELVIESGPTGAT